MDQFELKRQMATAAEILEALPRIDPNRRALILAAAGVAYNPRASMTDYAPALMSLPLEKLGDIAFVAESFARDFSTASGNQVPEQDRVLYLAALQTIIEEIDADDDLTPTERQHVTSLTQALSTTLESASQTGTQPVVTAATAVVGDAVVNATLWQRLSAKPWLKKLARVAAAVIMLVSGYSSAKELSTDVTAWFGPRGIVKTCGWACHATC